MCYAIVAKKISEIEEDQFEYELIEKFKYLQRAKTLLEKLNNKIEDNITLYYLIIEENELSKFIKK